MQLRVITDNDFKQLLDLYLAMGKSINANFTDFQIIFTLLTSVSQNPSFAAFGLFDDDVLLGFSCGWGLSEEKFYFSGFYVTGKNNPNTRNLIEFSFAEIKARGFTNWELDATNENIASMMEKFGATVKSTKYGKEL